jgi:hypothetical protein
MDDDDQPARLGTGAVLTDKLGAMLVRVIPSRWRQVTHYRFRVCPDCGAMVPDADAQEMHHEWHEYEQGEEE